MGKRFSLAERLVPERAGADGTPNTLSKRLESSDSPSSKGDTKFRFISPACLKFASAVAAERV